MSRVRAVITGCGVTSLDGLQPEVIQNQLAELRQKEDLGAKTYNHYVQAIDSFCRWLVRSGRMAANPLVNLSRLNTEVDIRHQRRALTPEEMSQLIASARSQRQTHSRLRRRTACPSLSVSFLTGLRRSELASLTRQAFNLAGNAAHRNRRRGVLKASANRRPAAPSRLDCRWLGSGWPANKPSDKLFPKLDRKKTWLMVKKDLERVGIAYETEEGIADFHAAGRHTHITELLRNGATLAEAKELARHSDVKMTMRYTHIGMTAKPRPCVAPQSEAQLAAMLTRHSRQRNRQSAV